MCIATEVYDGKCNIQHGVVNMHARHQRRIPGCLQLP